MSQGTRCAARDASLPKRRSSVVVTGGELTRGRVGASKRAFTFRRSCDESQTSEMTNSISSASAAVRSFAAFSCGGSGGARCACNCAEDLVPTVIGERGCPVGWFAAAAVAGARLHCPRSEERGLTNSRGEPNFDMDMWTAVEESAQLEYSC